MKIRAAVLVLGLAAVLAFPRASGAQWVRAGGPGGCEISALVVVGTNIFAATHIVRNADDGCVYSSADNGKSWASVSLGFPQATWVLCFAAVGRNLFAGTAGAGVFLTTDNGEHWTPVRSGLPGRVWIESLAVSGTAVYAGTDHAGVFLSTDNGASWTAANSGLPPECQIRSLAANDTHIFAGTDRAGIFVLKSGEARWTAAGPKAWVESLAANGQNIYAGTRNGIFLSHDNGVSWTAASFGLPEGLQDVCFAVSGPNIYVGTEYAGLFVSRDDGASWTAAGAALMPWVIDCLALSGKTLVAGTGSGGFFISADDGANWTTANSGMPEGMEITDLEAIGSNIFAATSGSSSAFLPDGRQYEGGVFVSADNGASWSPVTRGLTNTLIGDLAVVGTDLFAGTLKGVFLTPDNGASWAPVNSGFPEDASVEHLAVSESKLYAGTDKGIFLSLDNGASWTPVDPGLPEGAEILCLAASGPVLYAAVNHPDHRSQEIEDYRVWSNTVFQDTGLGVFRTENTGSGWTTASSGLPKDPYVCSLEADGPDLYAGLMRPGVSRGKLILRWDSGLGLFISTNRGAGWKAAGPGLPPKARVQDLLSSGDSVFAATAGDGVFVSRNKGKSWRALNFGLPKKASISRLLASGPNLFAAIAGQGVWRLPLENINLKKRP